MNCPIKNSSEYRMLKEQLGSDEAAIYTWKAYNGQYPPSEIFKPTDELKEELNILDYGSGRYVEIIDKGLKRYNRENKTSHHFVATSIEGKDKYRISFKVSYIPEVLLIKQIEAFNRNNDWTKPDISVFNPNVKGLNINFRKIFNVEEYDTNIDSETTKKITLELPSQYSIVAPDFSTTNSKDAISKIDNFFNSLSNDDKSLLISADNLKEMYDRLPLDVDIDTYLSVIKCNI